MNRAHAKAQKKRKDTEEARRKRKNLEHDELEKRRRQQRHDGLPVEPSPSPSLSDSSSDDDESEAGRVPWTISLTSGERCSGHRQKRQAEAPVLAPYKALKSRDDPEGEPLFALEDTAEGGRWDSFEQFRRLAEQSLQTALFVVADDLPGVAQELEARSLGKSLFLWRERDIWDQLRRQKDLLANANELLAAWSVDVEDLRLHWLEKEVSRAAEASVEVHVVLEAEIQEHNALQSAARTACEALEVGGVESGSSLGSRLIALSGRVHERLRGALHTGIKRALAVVSSHYTGIDLKAISDGYVLAEDDEEAEAEVMKLGLEEMSSHKSCFLPMEHDWEAAMSWRVAELEHELESTCHESQGRAAEATEVRATELLVVEWATAADQGLEAAKVRQAKTEAALQKSLVKTEVVLQSSLEVLEMEQKALESERKARSKVDQEVLALHGHVLRTKELNARLLLSLSFFFQSLVGSLEQDLETARAAIGQNAEALAKSLEERCVLEGELYQLRNVA
ncbi:uncharacterized protein [Miscanthus floridulus]|uniref:uncharacterized protein n=1 Tax=Miscanthus floridulus TaxID=154761 RepID=UPI00345A8607